MLNDGALVYRLWRRPADSSSMARSDPELLKKGILLHIVNDALRSCLSREAGKDKDVYRDRGSRFIAPIVRPWSMR